MSWTSASLGSSPAACLRLGQRGLGLAGAAVQVRDGRHGAGPFFSVGILLHHPHEGCGGLFVLIHAAERGGDLAVDQRAGILLQEQLLHLDQALEPPGLVVPALGVGDDLRTR